VLHAPKGMAIHGDTLWVADIDALRGFERRTGAPLATIDFSAHGPVLLNDVAVAPDGTLRVTDTGIVMSPKGVVHTGPDRIFAVGPGGAVTVAAEGLALRQPNGIAWDASARRWVVVSFDTFVGEVAAMPAAGGAREVLHRSTLGRFDGVEVLPNGTILYAAWQDSSIHALAAGRDRRIVREVQEPADIGLDTRRGVLAVPLSTLGRVQLWKLGPDVVGTRPRQ
jgi:sugar lactone lactonase YvrE